MKLFKAILALSIFSIGLIGCDPLKSKSDLDESGVTSQTDSSPQGSGETANAQGGDGNQGGSSDGIRPMAGVGAGGITPISGAESVGGEGGGVGQAAKDRAKKVAGTAPSSLNGATDDGQ